MKQICLTRLGPVVIIIMVIMLCASNLVHADQNITQTFELKTGWNTMFTEVTPTDPDPDVIFAGTPITQAITYYPKNSPVQFIQDPDETPWDKHGWSRWAPEGTPQALFKNLFSIQANQPYLLYCTQDHILQITGSPKFQEQEWQPDAFNLVGFHVDKTVPPTFAQFFESSRAHGASLIYYLQGGQWLKVARPSDMDIASGQAYWVWCEGGSDFQGPMEVSLPGTGDGLSFLAAVDELDIKVTNRSSNPLSFTLSPVQGTVPLSLRRTDVTADPMVIYEPFTSYSPETALESGESHEVRLVIRRKEISADEVTGVLRIMDDMGNSYYIKVRAEKI